MLPYVPFHNRRAVRIENEMVRVSLTEEGGHIAEFFHKRAQVSPLWIPPWPSIEPSTYKREQHPEYGSDAESKLLAGIMGHNLCLDLFGPPSAEEAAAGLTVHGEASVERYEFSSIPDGCIARCRLPAAQLHLERELRLLSNKMEIRETVENLAAHDRPVAWQEHVTLGPPFLECGKTQFRAPATKCATLAGRTEFEWPWLPQPDGSRRDLRIYTDAKSSSGFTTQLLDCTRSRSYALAFSPSHRLLLGYVWNTADFPWLGMWEENRQRETPPWSGRTQTLGLEFGTSPFPETRRSMISRNSLFDTPTYRWIPARTHVSVTYYAGLAMADRIPESIAEFESLLSQSN